MNKLLFVFLFFGLFFSAMAQSEGIRFEEGKSWKELVEEAKKADRPLFVDCYASWCGPCKMMAKNIFTLPEVGKYFNANFINAKFDIEKDADGKALAAQYEVKVLPTMLFINPKTGEVLQQLVGERDDKGLVEEARTARLRFTDPEVWAAYQAEQQRKVYFEPLLDWKKIVKKAKKERKLIFIVFGNGGEKGIEDMIFVRDSVFNFYNAHFVNVHCNVAKEGNLVHLNGVFSVKNLPTWAFIDPNSLEVVHQMEGAGNTEWFLSGARAAVDPENNLKGMTGRFATGERDVGFMEQYVKAMAAGNISGIDAIVIMYLDMLSVEQLLVPENWSYFVKYMSDPLSLAFQKVMVNREQFYDAHGKSAVDYCLEFALNSAVDALVFHISADSCLDDNRRMQLIHYLQSVDYPAAPAMLARLYAADCILRKNYKELVENMRYTLRLNVLPASEVLDYIKINMKALSNCTERTILRMAVRVLDEKCVTMNTFYGKADLLHLKADLLQQIGDTEDVCKVREQEATYRVQGDKAGEW